MELIFYNNYHNGDIHLSRTFVEDIIKKTNYDRYYYIHKNSSTILKDINNLIYMKATWELNDKVLIFSDNSYTYINTWFNPHFEHFKKYHCTLKTLYLNFKDIYNVLGIKLEDIEYYIPSIDFKYFNTSLIDLNLKDFNYDKYVYISNGDTMSGQSDNEELSSYIINLSNRYKNYLFITSNEFENNEENIIPSKLLIGSDGFNDLNENAYITTKCDIIIGRDSGPFTFSIIKDNILTDKKQTFIMIASHKNYKLSVDLKLLNINKNVINLMNNNELYYLQY